jgi:hypothetical protein
MKQQTGRTIEAVNENLIDAAAANESKQTVQPRTVGRRSGVTVVVEAFLQQCPAVFGSHEVNPSDELTD